MIKKLTGLTLAAAGMFAISSVSASDAACCMKGASNDGKKECSDHYAKLNLTVEQKTKLTALQEQCNKAGCTEASRATFLKNAKKILSVDQFAQLKSECDKTPHAQRTQS
jgi:hypothetical protein